MSRWTLEIGWAGAGLLGAGLAAGVIVAAVAGVGLLLFGVTQGRAAR